LIHVPLGDLDGITHNFDETELVSSRDVSSDALVVPLLGQFISVDSRETTKVGNAST